MNEKFFIANTGNKRVVLGFIFLHHTEEKHLEINVRYI